MKIRDRRDGNVYDNCEWDADENGYRIDRVAFGCIGIIPKEHAEVIEGEPEKGFKPIKECKICVKFDDCVESNKSICCDLFLQEPEKCSKCGWPWIRLGKCARCGAVLKEPEKECPCCDGSGVVVRPGEDSEEMCRACDGTGLRGELPLDPKREQDHGKGE